MPVLGWRQPGLMRKVGVVVQLVRISACHVEGRGFESRPLRHTSPYREVSCQFIRGSLKRKRSGSSVG